MQRPNSLSPEKMSPAERRAELCSLLALGLVRLLQRDQGQPSEKMEKFSYTIGSTGAFMQPRLTGGLHDDA
jgi:hypothetical protein